MNTRQMYRNHDLNCNWNWYLPQ